MPSPSLALYCVLMHSHQSRTCRRTPRPRFCVARLPRDLRSLNNPLGEFARSSSTPWIFSHRKPWLLVFSPRTPASFFSFRQWSHRLAPGHRRLRLPIPWMHSESSDQDPTDENKTYSFDGYFSKESLRFLESNPQSKTYRKK